MLIQAHEAFTLCVYLVWLISYEPWLLWWIQQTYDPWPLKSTIDIWWIQQTYDPWPLKSATDKPLTSLDKGISMENSSDLSLALYIYCIYLIAVVYYIYKFLQVPMKIQHILNIRITGLTECSPLLAPRLYATLEIPIMSW